jgi:oligopeptide transport system substrate-binding protein
MNNRTIHRQRWRRGAVAATASLALVLSACGNGEEATDDADANGAENGEQVSGGGTVTAYNCQPQNLMPSNSSEVCGSWVLEQLFTGLTQVDYDTFEPVPGVATSWDSNEDQTVWTFEIGEGWTFHNGEEITAQTFVDTFNWTVDPENAQQNNDFYDVFVGYEDLVEGDAEELEGVSAVDDYTLELELNEPFSPLPMMLSYTGFYPMPQEAFDDPEAFENAPIGNGRYQMDGEWEHDVQIAVERYEDWPGEDPGVPERIEWQIYSDIETAYLDVQAGALDILDTVPPNRLGTMEDDFGDNQALFETSSFTYMGLPLYQEEFDEADVRHALSMAIDREEIIDNIFDGAQVPAGNIIPPMLPQAREDACEYCDFDPDAAAELYEEADGPSELTVYFNSGAGHEDWVEAVSNQWQQHLGIEDVTFQSLEFAQYLDLHDDQSVTGPFRLGWVLSYPSPQYAMEPIYTSGQSSNYTTFENEEFDDLIAQANASDPEDADEYYQQAEDILLEEMPVIPMWFQSMGVVHSDQIEHDSVTMDPRTFLRVEQLQVIEEE